MLCPSCKTPNAASSQKCWSCGRELPASESVHGDSESVRRTDVGQTFSYLGGRRNGEARPTTCPLCREPVKRGASMCPHCRAKILSQEEVIDMLAECRKKMHTNQSFGCFIICIFAIITIWAFFIEGILYALFLPFLSFLVSLPNIIEIRKRFEESEELKKYAKEAGYKIARGQQDRSQQS